MSAVLLLLAELLQLEWLQLPYEALLLLLLLLLLISHWLCIAAATSVPAEAGLSADLEGSNYSRPR
jgi:hypothetical protein